MQATHLGIETVEAGREPGKMAPAVQCLFRKLERLFGRFAEALGFTLRPAVFGNLVKFRFRALDLSEGGNVLAGVESAFNEVAAHSNQRPEKCQVIDLRSEIASADDCCSRPCQLR